ncbi:MAG: hypothetical protein HYR55_05125 [Acidobacteria bacterium]|nr:hypothetical protein [Acidobacteriota bacterium]
MSKRIAIFGLLAAGLLALESPAQTVDEVISKNNQARGGLDKLKAVKSMRMTGKIITQGMDAPLNLQSKRPNKLRVEMTIQGKTMVQGFDGETAWWIMPFMGSTDAEKMPQQEATSVMQQADMDGPLVDYKDKGHKVELIGKEDMEGTPVYKLKLTLKSGDLQYIYLDSQNFIQLKQTVKLKRPAGDVEVDIFYGDYKPVNGLMIPHSIERKSKGQPVAQVSIVKVELDNPAEDAIFTMPAKSPEKPPAKTDK